TGALQVRILDAQNKRAPVMPGKKPIEKGSARPPDVKMSCGTRRKSNPDGGHEGERPLFLGRALTHTVYGCFCPGPLGLPREAQRCKPPRSTLFPADHRFPSGPAVQVTPPRPGPIPASRPWPPPAAETPMGRGTWTSRGSIREEYGNHGDDEV